MRINDDCRQRDRTTMQHYSDRNKPGYNVYICRNDEEMTNVYSCNLFQLIFGVMVD